MASTVALVVEIVSPGDESWQKLPFYAAHSAGELADRIDWPPSTDSNAS